MPRSQLHWAVTDAEMHASLRQLGTVVAIIPEEDCAGWYQSMGRIARNPNPQGSIYHYNKLASAWQRVASACWADDPTWRDDQSWRA